MESGNLNPACLPPGTRVGPWRVVGLQGRGTYGAVYRAEAVEPEASGPVALKLALYPRDERFGREVELLSRLHHPNVPRLLGQGYWQHPAGAPHPYLVMELIEGVPLYDWAQANPPSSRHLLRVLASVAHALEATHAMGGVHRDVKGNNVLVRDGDGQPFLTDFGSCHYRGAATLTWQAFPPGTPAYRAPEAWRSVLHPAPGKAESYAPGPADDVFALGVTAYRLVTQEYPTSTHPSDDESRIWHEEGSGPRPASECNRRCCPELSALIARMLSPRPEVRGSARELAEAMEQAARSAGPEADESLFVRDAPRPPSARPFPGRVPPRALHRARRLWPMAASLGGALVMGTVWMLGVQPDSESAHAPVEKQVDTRDGGTVAVGDSVLTSPEASARPPPSAWSLIALDMPPKPLPGQTRADANGRCPRRGQIPLQGGCWFKLAADAKDCPEDSYVYKGACYLPAFPPARPATSSPADRSNNR